MPKTASKRAQARKEAKINRAHQVPQPVPEEKPQYLRPKSRGGIAGAVGSYPLLSAIVLLAVIGFSVLIAHQQQLLWWAPPGPPAQATCNLKTHICDKAPFSVLEANKAYTATIKTAKGTIVIQLDTKDAPHSANSFIFLAEQGFYNGLDFWKVERLNQLSPETNQPSNIDLIQGGRGGDSGGPGYTVKSASTQGQYKLGVVAMANASQFFINTVDNSQAITNTSYPVLGNVISGMNVAKAITRGDKIISITITSKTIVPTPTPKATATAVATATATAGATATAKAGATATATP